MNTTPSVLLTWCCFSIFGPSVSAAIVLFEDFEDAMVTYTTSVPEDLSDIANRDYFGRISTVNSSVPPPDVSYLNMQGSGYFGAQDTDDANSGNIDLLTVNWTGIDISNFTDLDLSWMVAEDDAADGNEDWDIDTSVRLDVQLDGGGFSQIFGIEGADAFFGNRLPRVDTNFDGVGDGLEITHSLTLFNRALADGLLLDIRLTIESLDTGDEDIAFDNLLLSGTPTAIPEPSSFVFMLVAILGFWGTWFR